MMQTVVIVGDSICGSSRSKALAASDDVFLRGFNTYAGSQPTDGALALEGGGEVVAAINGAVDITDRVVSIKGRLPRYIPEIGDVVVGRIQEVAGNRWLVDVKSNQTAIMLLSNVTEPGGILRRRGRGDELGMRQLFDQEDLIVAEVQRITPEGVISLHTRAGDKYGKITTPGQLVSVRPSLMKRAKHQFLYLDQLGCQLVLGVNGNIWVSYVLNRDDESSDTEARHNAARVSNCIKVLGDANFQVHPLSIEKIVEASLDAGLSPLDVLLAKHQETLLVKVRELVGQKRQR